MKPIKYSRHAKNRMRWHRITESEIEMSIYNSDFRESFLGDKINAWKKLSEKYLRVTYKEEAERIFIITAVKKKKGWG